MRSICSPQRRKERKGLIIIRKSALLFFAVLSTAKNKKKHLSVLRVSAVKAIGSEFLGNIIPYQIL
jgi:hypothetical protein